VRSTPRAMYLVPQISPKPKQEHHAQRISPQILRPKVHLPQEYPQRNLAHLTDPQIPHLRKRPCPAQTQNSRHERGNRHTATLARHVKGRTSTTSASMLHRDRPSRRRVGGEEVSEALLQLSNHRTASLILLRPCSTRPTWEVYHRRPRGPSRLT
jgi:hypothetical protein